MWEEKGIHLYQSPIPVVVKCVENRGLAMYLETPSARVKKRILVKAIKESGRSYNLHLGYVDLKTGDYTCDCNYLAIPVYIFVGVANLRTNHTTNTHNMRKLRVSHENTIHCICRNAFQQQYLQGLPQMPN